MATRTRPDGRRTRELNADAQADLARAIRRLADVIRGTDPVEFNRAAADVVVILHGIQRTLAEVEQIHALAAQRGPYNKNGDEEE